MKPDASIIVAIISTVGLIAGTVIGAILAHRSNQETSLLQQLNNVQKRLDASEMRERVRDDYILVLRQKLQDSGVPVPQYPDELRHAEAS